MALAPGARLRTVDAPVLPEDQLASPQSAPCETGSFVECNWCKHTFKSIKEYNTLKEWEEDNKTRRKIAVEEDRDRKEQEKDEESRGALAPVAASIVMKIIWGARFCRMDCLRIIGFIACSFHALDVHLR